MNRPILGSVAGMEEIIDALWPLPRDIISDGYDHALGALASQVFMKVHEYPTGRECFTWIVPEKWTCSEGYLASMEGNIIFSYADNPLHVVSYSLPFEGVVSRAELFSHLHAHPRSKNAIPFVYKYYQRDWGLCCSQTTKDQLIDDRYKVVIRSVFSNGTLKVGEVVAPGKSENSIILCAHLCHPHMVNDDLSGVAVGIDVMRELIRRNNLRYTYRLIILPETIGSAAYLSHNSKLIPRMKGGIFLEMLGTGHPHSLQLSLFGNSEIDKCSRLAVREHDPGARVDDFLNVILNDERMFNAPGIRVPMVSLSRVLEKDHPEYPYKEYHSSLDTPESVDMGRLYDSRKLILEIIDFIENDYIPAPRFKGELFCSRYKGIDYSKMEEVIHKVIYILGEGYSVADICEKTGLNSTPVRNFLEILFREGLIEKIYPGSDEG